MMSAHLPAGDPASASSSFAERGVIVEGLRIASAMRDAPRALLARAPLVVLPAPVFTWRAYLPLMERFAASRRVFALDWPGFGGSDKPAPSAFTYSAASYARLLAGWMDALGIGRAVLLGNGLGGTVALRYALAHAPRVLGLVLVAPEGFAVPTRLRQLRKRLLRVTAIRRRLEPWLASLALGPDTPVTRALLQELATRRDAPEAAATCTAAAALARAESQPQGDMIALARHFAAPALVIRGALDPVVTAAEARAATAALGAHGALEVVLPEAGHLPFLQQPEGFQQAVDGLLTTAEMAALG